MLMFVVCAHCKATIEDRFILDTAQFISWYCPKCGKENIPISTVSDDDQPEDIEDNEIKIEIRDASQDSLEGNILEGLI